MTEAVVASPDGEVEVVVRVVDGAPTYAVRFEGADLVRPSRLGLELADGVSLATGLVLVGSATARVDETWEQPWGETREVRDHHVELRVDLEQEGTGLRWSLRVRAFDDGVGFRYEVPRQPGLHRVVVTDELTEFVFADDHTTWSIPAYQPNRYEYLHERLRLGEYADARPDGVHTPVTLATRAGPVLALHEAALVDYASMTLRPTGPTTLKADLVPWSDGVLVRTRTPITTPWRTIRVARDPAGLLTSMLELNLNEPCVLADTSWVRPGKYIGIWWEMHLGESTWAPGPDHGATTANARRYIDVAAEHGLDGVLVEGWNRGWEHWEEGGEHFDFTTPYDDFDLEAVAAYAAERGVRLIGHHETASAVATYERQLDDALDLYARLGVDVVKTGYVGHGRAIARHDDAGRLLGHEWHHGQHMVRHHQRVTEAAAARRIALDVHEPVKDTGLRRTWPNLMTREGARGQEYNAWGSDGGNPPDHVVVLAFTRMLSGPMDYTPGVFDLLRGAGEDNRVRHTLAKELALYVVLYSPLQMVADLPRNLVDAPAFRFVRDVPVDWRDTRVPHARIGEYVTVVRADRHGDDWYLGSITDEQPRELPLALDFLDPARRYVAEVYADGAGAHWEHAPLSLDVREEAVDATTTMTLRLAPGGGTAVRFRALSA